MYPHYETDPKVIVRQLSKFLEDLRKKKAALDLIGNDGREPFAFVLISRRGGIQCRVKAFSATDMNV